MGTVTPLTAGEQGQGGASQARAQGGEGSLGLDSHRPPCRSPGVPLTLARPLGQAASHNVTDAGRHGDGEARQRPLRTVSARSSLLAVGLWGS